jgi:hypothetical protein
MTALAKYPGKLVTERHVEMKPSDFKKLGVASHGRVLVELSDGAVFNAFVEDDCLLRLQTWIPDFDDASAVLVTKAPVVKSGKFGASR